MIVKSSPFFQTAYIWITALGLIIAGSDKYALAQGQGEATRKRLLLLERIRLDSKSVFICDDLDIVESGMVRFLNDFGYQQYERMVRDYVPNFETEGLAPGVATTKPLNGTFQFFLESPQEFADAIGASHKAMESGQLGKEAFSRFLAENEFTWFTFNEHLVASNDLFLGDGDVASQRSGETYKWEITDELLWPTLDERTREIVLQSVISVVSRYEPTESKGGFDSELEQLQSALTPAERDWLEAMREVSQSSKRQILGIKYHDRLLELQARAQTGEGKSYDKLVRPNSGSENWIPDLGLEREQLVLAAAIQLNAFPNSAAARVMPQIGLLFGEQQYDWLGGNMLQILTELIGDSWNDLSAARIAIYENSEAEKLGWLSMVGVTDSKDPSLVLRELERLAKLTSPEAAAEKNREREEEIARLIKDLAHTDTNLASRAESRLVLAGKTAIPALEEAAKQGNESVQQAAKRILRRWNDTHTQIDQNFAVSDPGFWTTLSPGLRFEKQTGRLAEFPTHTIHVTPDLAKTPEEVEEATRLMEYLFGPKWHTIQVIEVGTHFVFMIGSDQAQLERIVQRVSQGVGELSKDLDGKGNCNRNGQLQFWVHGYRFGNLLHPDMVRFRDDLPKKIRSSRQPIWMGIEFNGKGIEFKTLATPEQIRGAMGF